MKKRIVVSVIALVLALCFALPAFAADPVPVTGISLGEEKVSLPVGMTLNVKAVIDPKNATNKTLEWSSSDESVATVIKGRVRGVEPGTAVITAKASDDSGVTASLEVSIVKPVKKVAIDAGKTVALPVGFTQALSVEVFPEDATVKDVVWSSSNDKVAAVDEKGVVTAVAKGKAKITAEAADGSGAKAVVSVTVDEYDLVFMDSKPQEATYYYRSGRFKITGKSKTGCVSVPKEIGVVMAMIVGGPASDTVTVTPVKPGTDVITIKAGKTKTTIKVYVSPDAFKEPEKTEEAEKTE